MQEFLLGVTAPMREDSEPCMVKYQDTDAYKKATDEQLRHRDALEKEIRQREADKIQREAWRLDAIDRARAQLAPPIGATGSPRKRRAARGPEPPDPFNRARSPEKSGKLRIWRMRSTFWLAVTVVYYPRLHVTHSAEVDS